MGCGCVGAACACIITGGENIEVTTIGNESFISLETGALPVQNLFIQQNDPGPMAYAYQWVELNPDDTVKTIWTYTP